MSFSVEGVSYKWDENNDPASSGYMPLKIYGLSVYGIYNLFGNNWYPRYAHPNRVIQIPINTQTLSVNTTCTYTNTDTVPNLEGARIISNPSVASSGPSYFAYPGDHATVIITKIKKNSASGTFTARFTNSTLTKADIRDGKLKI